jgi:hypothetical protein
LGKHSVINPFAVDIPPWGMETGEEYDDWPIDSGHAAVDMGLLDPDTISDRERKRRRCEVIVKADSDTAAHFRSEGRHFLFSRQDSREGVILLGCNPALNKQGHQKHDVS